VKRLQELEDQVAAAVTLREKVAELDQWKPEAMLSAIVEQLNANQKALYNAIAVDDASKQFLIWLVRDAMTARGHQIDDLVRQNAELQKQLANSEAAIVKNQDDNTVKILRVVDRYTWLRGWPFFVFAVVFFFSGFPLFLSATGVCLVQVICCSKYFRNRNVEIAAVTSLQCFFWGSAITATAAAVCGLAHHFGAFVATAAASALVVGVATAKYSGVF